MRVYILNKIVGTLICPATAAFVGYLFLLIGLFWASKKHCSKSLVTFLRGLAILIGIWFWLWSTPFMCALVGAALERDYLIGGRVPDNERYPQADLIHILGGGMAANEHVSKYAEMSMSADRVWQGARLYHLKKAPKILATGGSVETSTSGLLHDFGVPANAVIYASAPRNTEEEARFVATNHFRSVLLVTSAWHMKRAELMYRKYAPGVQVIPAPCDFEFTLKSRDMTLGEMFMPEILMMYLNGIAVHEWVGYLGYRWLR